MEGNISCLAKTNSDTEGAGALETWPWCPCGGVEAQFHKNWMASAGMTPANAGVPTWRI